MTPAQLKSRPKTQQEKEQFKAIVMSMSRDYNNEMNFQEAVKESHRAWFDSRCVCCDEISIGMQYNVIIDVSVSSGNLNEDEAWQVVATQKDKTLTTQSTFFW